MAKAEKTPLSLTARIKMLLDRDTARQLTPAQLRQRGIRRRRYLRAGIQAFFFLTMPSAFVAGFTGVKHLFQWIGAGEVLQMDSFVCALIGLALFTILFGRWFCGFACAFGGLGDFVYWLSGLVQKKLFHRKKQYRLPEKLVRRGAKGQVSGAGGHRAAVRLRHV
ncbi:MAG: 4Fe-4S binding protein [Clostridiales bacterium]|nr:4Fe-4S binding protein [Clostridiales bacterium]